MGGIFVVFPTANMPRAEATALKWVARGYGTGFLVNAGDGTPCEYLWRSGRAGGWEERAPYDGTYGGYYVSQNALARYALRVYEADAVVCAGDDMDPDPNKTAAVILAECRVKYPDDCYVMQPTGDPQGQMKGVPASARICGSPWFGPAYIQHGYGGRGPFWPEYWHMAGDLELRSVAENLGILWQRPDLTQWHHHWSFRQEKPLPYQEQAGSHWDKDHVIYEQRKAAGWPCYELGAA